MATPADLLEPIGRAVLPSLGRAPEGDLLKRRARAVWTAWTPNRDSAGRSEDLEGLLEKVLSNTEELKKLADQVGAKPEEGK